MREYEDAVNRARARERAMKLKEYCKTFRRCDECVFYIGTCQLQRHPIDWDLKRVVWDEGRDT